MSDTLLFFAVFCAGAFTGGFVRAVLDSVAKSRGEWTVTEEVASGDHRVTMRATAGTLEEARAIIRQTRAAMGVDRAT